MRGWHVPTVGSVCKPEQRFGAWTNLVFFMSAGTFQGKCLIEGDGVVHREFVA